MRSPSLTKSPPNLLILSKHILTFLSSLTLFTCSTSVKQDNRTKRQHNVHKELERSNSRSTTSFKTKSINQVLYRLFL